MFGKVWKIIFWTVIIMASKRGGKTGKRKMWKRKARKGRKTVNINRALQPIPQRYICKMKYSDTMTFSSVAGTTRWNLNSIFDPNRSGGGHQPYGHDTFQTLYNRYRVIACSYVITAYNGTNAIRVAALPANEELLSGSVSEAVENPRCKFIQQYPGGNTRILKGKVYLPSLVGRTTDQYMADDRYQATFGTSPSELAILNVFCANMTDSNVDGTVANIQLTYHVEMFDVKHLGQS